MLSLFALGSNGSGQLGIGHEEDVNVPTQVIWNGPVDASSRPRRIVAGGNHTVVLLDDGHAYFTGENSDGRCLGQEVTKTSTLTPVLLEGVLAGARIALCACTWEASVAVLKDGRIIVSGTGQHGELGLGSGISGAANVRVLQGFPPVDTTVVDLTSSMNHFVVVLSNGDVYGWGAGRRGQLGSLKEDSWQPRKLDNVPFFARRAVAGTNFSYVFGDSATSELVALGIDKWGLISGRPYVLSSWIDITASWGSIFMLQRTGGLLSWGRNDHCQLGPFNMGTISAIAAGSEHAVCLKDDGKVLTWGWGEHGNCGPLVSLETHDIAGQYLNVSGRAVFVGAGCATTWIGSIAELP